MNITPPSISLRQTKVRFSGLRIILPEAGCCNKRSTPGDSITVLNPKFKDALKSSLLGKGQPPDTVEAWVRKLAPEENEALLNGSRLAIDPGIATLFALFSRQPQISKAEASRHLQELLDRLDTSQADPAPVFSEGKTVTALFKANRARIQRVLECGRFLKEYDSEKGIQYRFFNFFK